LREVPELRCQRSPSLRLEVPGPGYLACDLSPAGVGEVRSGSLRGTCYAGALDRSSPLEPPWPRLRSASTSRRSAPPTRSTGKPNSTPTRRTTPRVSAKPCGLGVSRHASPDAGSTPASNWAGIGGRSSARSPGCSAFVALACVTSGGPTCCRRCCTWPAPCSASASSARWADEEDAERAGDIGANRHRVLGRLVADGGLAFAR
jgi:hypothetical protein